MTTIKPATPLQAVAYGQGNAGATITDASGEYVAETGKASDAFAIVHAANAYPELVAALRRLNDCCSKIAGDNEMVNARHDTSATCQLMIPSSC